MALNEVIPAVVDCRPATKLAEYPCLNCLSQTKLKWLLLAEWAFLAGYTLPDDLQTLLALSKCNTCTSETQRMEMEIASIADALGRNAAPEDIPTISSILECMPCIKSGQLDAMLSYLKCLYFKGLNLD